MRLQDKARELIKEQLHALHYTQKVLARRLGISDSAMTRKLNGESSFTDDELKISSQFLQIPDLFDYPVRRPDQKAVCASYDPGVGVINDAMALLTNRDKSEMYLSNAIALEGKLPHTKHAALLREIAASLS